jgi:hypothetical protein
MRELDRIRDRPGPPGRPPAALKHRGATALARAVDHPTPALVKELQHSAGNRAVTRLLQRQPEAAPPAEAAPAVDEVLDEYFQLLTDVASSNQKSVTGFRREFMRDLEAELGGEYQAFAEMQNAGKQPAPAAVKRFQDRLLEYQNQWFFERHAGYEAWKELKTQCQDELRRLNEQGDFASLAAAKVLSSEYADTERRAGRLGMDLIAEDLAPLTYMMVRGKHIEIGGLRAQRMGESFEADLAEYESEEAASLVNLAGDDSVLKTAWDVFGWDSVGEFAADVALTIITFGASKWLRTAAKADKLRRRAARIKELRRLLMARRAERAKKKITRAAAALHLLRGDVRGAFAEQLKWLKSNWSKVGRKVLTDLTASKAQGSDLDIAGTAGRRAAKEYVNASVMAHFGKDDKYERRVLHMAWAKQFKGKDELAKTLYAAYFMLNVRRRLLVNAIYYGAVETGKLEFPDGHTLRRIAVATVGECVQDLITAIPVFDLPVIKDGVESLRKYLVKEIEGLVQ